MSFPEVIKGAIVAVLHSFGSNFVLFVLHLSHCTASFPGIFGRNSDLLQRDMASRRRRCRAASLRQATAPDREIMKAFKV